MICPNCAAQCGDDHLFCFQCGTRLSEAEFVSLEDNVLTPDAEPVPETEPVSEPMPQEPVVQPEPAPVPPPKKGHLWPPLLILALMICAGTALFFLLPGATPGPTGPVTQDAPWFAIENGVLSFHEEYYSGPSELAIPETVNGQPVIGIADYAFSGVDSLTTVILPNTVTIIGDYAFSSCNNLRGIYVPDSVLSVGSYAFADCDKLEAIYLPGSLMELGHSSLDSCDSLHFILFDGTYSQWLSLYKGYFVSTVELHTTDGIYYTRP